MKHRTSYHLLRTGGFLPILAAWSGLLVPLRSAPPADLVVEGVPEIPDSIFQATAPYWTVNANAFMGWDPKTGAMLVNSVSQETRQLQLIASPQGEIKMKTQFPDYIMGASFMPTVGDRVVFAADHAGDEFYQLYGLDVSTGSTQLLTDGDSWNENTIYDHTGKQIAYLSIMPEARFPQIFAMDPRDPDSRRIIMSPENGGWVLEDWAHDGGSILAAHLRSLRAGYLWSIDTLTGETTLLTKDPATQRPYIAARYLPHDEGLYVIIMDGPETSHVDYVSLNNTGQVRKVPPKVTKATEIELSPDGTYLAYLTDEDDAEKLHIFNTLTGEELPQVPLEPALFGRMQWNAESTELGFNYGSTSMPFQAYSYKIPTRQLFQWTQANVANLPATPVQPELVRINSFDGLEIPGYLYRPDPKKFPGKRPVLICIHGGPAAQYRPDFLGAYNYYLDEMGVALLYPNVRGSTGYGPEFADLATGKKREDAVKDIGAFLDWIATDPRLDSNRVGVQGGSYGGYMTLATLYHYGNRVRCGSDLMGFTDFVTLLRNTKKFWQASARMQLGDERYPDMNQFLESISPLNHAAEIHDPVMITAGKNDPRVPASESEQMVKAIRAQNGIIWYILGENEGHGFRRVSDSEYQFAAEAYFFQTYLLPEKRLTPLGPTEPIDATPAPASAEPD